MSFGPKFCLYFMIGLLVMSLIDTAVFFFEVPKYQLSFESRIVFSGIVSSIYTIEEMFIKYVGKKK